MPKWVTGKECKLCSCPALQNNAQKLSFQTLTFVETLTCCRRPYGQIYQSAQADSYWVNKNIPIRTESLNTQSLSFLSHLLRLWPGSF